MKAVISGELTLRGRHQGILIQAMVKGQDRQNGVQAWRDLSMELGIRIAECAPVQSLIIIHVERWRAFLTSLPHKYSMQDVHRRSAY